MMERTPFAQWYGALPERSKSAFARRAKTTRRNIEAHYLPARKIPRLEAMKNLAVASRQFSIGELASQFYEAALARAERRGRLQ